MLAVHDTIAILGTWARNIRKHRCTPNCAARNLSVGTLFGGVWNISDCNLLPRVAIKQAPQYIRQHGYKGSARRCHSYLLTLSTKLTTKLRSQIFIKKPSILRGAGNLLRSGGRKRFKGSYDPMLWVMLSAR